MMRLTHIKSRSIFQAFNKSNSPDSSCSESVVQLFWCTVPQRKTYPIFLAKFSRRSFAHAKQCLSFRFSTHTHSCMLGIQLFSAALLQRRLKVFCSLLFVYPFAQCGRNQSLVAKQSDQRVSLQRMEMQRTLCTRAYPCRRVILYVNTCIHTRAHADTRESAFVRNA